jgi:hypothetical protein
MPALDPKKKRQAFKLRLERKSFSEISRTLHMAPATVRKLEYGWVDKKGVRHRGWREKIEQHWGEDEKAELECGLALREERVKALKRIAQQAIDKVETQFPAVTMASPSDWKTLVSEIRELVRLLSDEVGNHTGAGRIAPPGRGVTTRMQITLEEVQEAYEEARAVEAEVVGLDKPPAPGQTSPDEETGEGVEPDPSDLADAGAADADHEEAGGDDADTGKEDAES